MNSWVDVHKTSDFSIHNLPFGIFSLGNGPKKIGVAIGNQIVDLHALVVHKLIDLDVEVVQNEFLNDFINLGKTVTSAIRLKVQSLLTAEDSPLKTTPLVFVNQSDANMHLPVSIGNYTDFFSSIEHATNCGKMIKDPDNPLFPNWKHLPVAYHGRASSIVVSGVPIHRPKGQVMLPGEKAPIFQPSSMVDFELEMGFIIGKNTQLGQSVPVEEAEDYIFGKVIFNDWSARDIQQWESIPLGPFLAKSFGSSISPWVVTMDALEPFRVAGPKQKPEVLPYLQYDGAKNFDIDLEVFIAPESSDAVKVCHSNLKYIYWNMAQQLAHHTVNGCNIQVGDIMASGTISGLTEDSYGCMLELAWLGTKPIKMKDGSERKFICDYDTVIMKAYAQKEGIRVGFGEVLAQLLPAL